MHFNATLWIHTYEFGCGRSRRRSTGDVRHFFGGYRPQFRYRGQENDASIVLPDDSGIVPGEATDALIAFYQPGLQRSRIILGSFFLIAEGRKNIAYGKVIEIMDAELANPSDVKVSVIFVDVDDTLIRSSGTKQIPIPHAVQYVRKMHQSGHLLFCWSRGGADYSREVALRLGIADCFVCFLPKPDLVLDDRLRKCLDHCEFLHPNNAIAPPQCSGETPVD